MSIYTKKQEETIAEYAALYAPLVEKLENALPITAYPTRELIQFVRESGSEKLITFKSVLTITSVFNSGDISGILCHIEVNGKLLNVIPLTVLVFDPQLPLYKEIEDYQIKRIKRIEKLRKMSRS